MRIFTVLMVLVTVIGCSKNELKNKEINKMYGSGLYDAGTLIDQLDTMQVFFGHQSVGFNIIEGLDAWQADAKKGIRVIESRDFDAISDASLVHFRVGQNGDLRGKIEDFAALVETMPREKKPVAFFKFCYVDFNPESDVEADFPYFKSRMIQLKDSFPEIRFVVCTVPYTAVQKGPKALIKNVLGKTPHGMLENIKRDEFNKNIRKDFDGVLPIFDLGGLESTLPDGSVETFTYKGEKYPCLPKIYRSDNGHLNDYGARSISYNLLAFLTEELK